MTKGGGSNIRYSGMVVNCPCETDTCSCGNSQSPSAPRFSPLAPSSLRVGLTPLIAFHLSSSVPLIMYQSACRGIRGMQFAKLPQGKKKNGSHHRVGEQLSPDWTDLRD